LRGFRLALPTTTAPALRVVFFFNTTRKRTAGYQRIPQYSTRPAEAKKHCPQLSTLVAKAFVASPEVHLRIEAIQSELKTL
jgi:hypothetical protein